MFEFTQSDKLIKGEKYFVKRKKIYVHTLKRHHYYGVFDDYNDVFEGFAWFKSFNDFELVELDLCLNEFYRCVSEEEYYIKLKEKYDDKCLNIILKRLVDESFQSDYLGKAQKP
jgi:hypothetical protein